MAFTPSNYTGGKKALDDMATEITGATLRADNAISNIRDQITNLDNMGQPAPTGWASAVSFINAGAAASPADQNWQRLKDEKDQMVTDFQAEKVRLEQIIMAIENI